MLEKLPWQMTREEFDATRKDPGGGLYARLRRVVKVADDAPRLGHKDAVAAYLEWRKTPGLSPIPKELARLKPDTKVMIHAVVPSGRRMIVAGDAVAPKPGVLAIHAGLEVVMAEVRAESILWLGDNWTDSFIYAPISMADGGALNIHRAVVSWALKAGQEVSPEAVKEYPDLRVMMPARLDTRPTWSLVAAQRACRVVGPLYAFLSGEDVDKSLRLGHVEAWTPKDKRQFSYIKKVPGPGKGKTVHTWRQLRAVESPQYLLVSASINDLLLKVYDSKSYMWKWEYADAMKESAPLLNDYLRRIYGTHEYTEMANIMVEAQLEAIYQDKLSAHERSSLPDIIRRRVFQKSAMWLREHVPGAMSRFAREPLLVRVVAAQNIKVLEACNSFRSEGFVISPSWIPSIVSALKAMGIDDAADAFRSDDAKPSDRQDLIIKAAVHMGYDAYARPEGLLVLNPEVLSIAEVLDFDDAMSHGACGVSLSDDVYDDVRIECGQAQVDWKRADLAFAKMLKTVDYIRSVVDAGRVTGRTDSSLEDRCKDSVLIIKAVRAVAIHGADLARSLGLRQGRELARYAARIRIPGDRGHEVRLSGNYPVDFSDEVVDYLASADSVKEGRKPDPITSVLEEFAPDVPTTTYDTSLLFLGMASRNLTVVGKGLDGIVIYVGGILLSEEVRWGGSVDSAGPDTWET